MLNGAAKDYVGRARCLTKSVGVGEEEKGNNPEPAFRDHTATDYGGNEAKEGTE